MKYEIINPSDPYTLEADDLHIAAVAVCLLGGGKYALRPTDHPDIEETSVPIFLFGGHDAWFLKRFGLTFEAAVDQVMMTRGDALVTCLRSVKLGREERTSLDDIGRKAFSLADHIEQHVRDHALRVLDAAGGAS